MTTNKQDVPNEMLGAVSAGEHDTPEATVFEESELVEWEFDERAVFELFSQKVYPDDEAGLRETLFNAYAAALRASKAHGIDPRVSVRLYEKEDGSLRLVVRDNGVGVTRETLDEAMVYIGRSQNRWVSDVLGKFGVGGLAAFRLIPHNGIFLMHTRARDTDEEFRGAWWTRGFEMETGDELPDVFGEDEYGTRFEFPLKNDISRSDVRSWVRQHAQHARVPVEYVEDGFENGDRTVYGGTRVGDFSQRTFAMTIETENFRAVCSPDASGQELMLDSPLSGRQDRRRRWNTGVREPFEVDIRYKNENGPVVAGPHAGLTPVSEGEYADLPEQVKDSFMIEANMTDDDIRLPFPTGTREQVEQTEDFYTWLRDRFAERYREHVQNAVGELDAPMDFFDLSDEEQQVFFTSPTARNIDVPTPRFGDRRARYQSSNMDVVVDDDDICEFFELLRTYVTVRTPDDTVNEQVLDVRERDEPVYMGISIHEGREALVHENGGIVVELPDGSTDGSYETGSALYDPLSSFFGWNQLKDVTASYAVETFGMDEDTATTMLNPDTEDDNNVDDEYVNIHFARNRWDHKRTVSHLRDHFNGKSVYSDDRWTHPPEELVLFTRSMDANLSDNYAFATDERAIAHCSQDVADELLDCPNVRRFDAVVETIEEPTVYTSDGEQPVSVLGDGDILHIASGEEYDAFSRRAEAMESHVQELFKTHYRIDNPTYAVIKPEAFADASKWVDADAVTVIGPDRIRSTTQHALSRTRAYAHLRLDEYTDTAVFTQLERNVVNDVTFERGGKVIIDAIATGIENGVDITTAVGDAV